MSTNPALTFLRNREWTMGNGQCHECCGNKPRHGWWTATVGHAPKCALAASIETLGGKVVWERANHSKKRRGMARFNKEINAFFIKELAAKISASILAFSEGGHL